MPEEICEKCNRLTEPQGHEFPDGDRRYSQRRAEWLRRFKVVYSCEHCGGVLDSGYVVKNDPPTTFKSS